MRSSAVMRKIVMPQAMGLIIPPAANNFIGLLKATALIAVISGEDLMTQAQVIYSANFQVIALLIVATIWYLAMVGLASVGQYFLERHFRTSPAASRRPATARLSEAS
jgi:polar amino acid transport system permease protein